MERVRRLLLLVAVSTAAVGCGSSTSGGQGPTGSDRSPHTVRLEPGHYTFRLGGRVVSGDELSCVTRAGAPAGGGVVPARGHGVGSSTGFSVDVLKDGRVEVTCPANPGNA
jgi:hypothetical protein